ncbi:MAG: HIT domain-containing protein [Acidobacteria bacterium]|nr:HIT domain-containing protein [Acidobacteriota bacterium]
MDRLWTPWRYAYVTKTGDYAKGKGRKGVPKELEAWPDEKDCVFCNMLGATEWAVASGTMSREDAERASHIVLQAEHNFVCLNAFPYTSGHLMIVPYQHLQSLAELPAEAASEMMQLAQRAERVLRTTYKPDGLNLGMNMGESAGAGVAEHIHLHALPRWVGDNSFMGVTAETRVLPEMLDQTWERLRSSFAAQ